MTETPDPEPQAPPAQAPRRPGRARRALAAAAKAIGLAAVFTGAAAAGLALHLDNPASRRIVREATNTLLGSLFEGKIIADEIDALSIRGVRIRAATAIDPRGGQVIRASGIEARADVLAILRAALLGDGDLRIEIPYIRIEHADVLVEANAEGGVTLGDTFTPLPDPPEAPSKAPSPPRDVRVALSRIEIGRGWVHGRVAPPRSLDADVSRLSGSVHVGPEGVSVDVDQTGLVDRAFLPATTAGTANYHLRAGEITRMWSSFSGQLSAVEVQARMVMTDGHIKAHASLPRATPAQIRGLLPDYPVVEPVIVEVDLDGEAPTFDVTASLTALPAGDAGGRVTLDGRVDASGPVRFEADALVRALDPRLFGAGLPAAQIEAQGRLRGEVGEALRLSVDARTAPTQALDEPVPAAELHVVLDRGELSGTVHLDEPGMPVDVVFAVLPGGEGVRFRADGEVASWPSAPRLSALARGMRGGGSVRVEGLLRGDHLDARGEAAVRGVRVGGDLELDRGRVEGRVSGPLDALRLEASLTGTDVRAAGLAFERVTASASGPARAPSLRATLTDGSDEVSASGRLDTRTGAVRGVDVRVRRDGDEVHGKVAVIAPRRGGVEVEGIEVTGDNLGSMAGGLSVRGGDVTGSLRGEGVDLGRVARMLGSPYRVRGLANVDVELRHDPKKGRSGKVLVELEGGEVSLLRGLSAHVSATIEDDQVKADGLLRLVGGELADEGCSGALAGIRLSRGEGTLRGPLLRGDTWSGLTGSAEVAAEDWDLRCLSRLAPLGAWLSDVRGWLTARLTVSRSPGERFASVRDGVMRTRGLELAGATPLAGGDPAWESRSIDGQVKGSLDGVSGKAEATLTLYDGELLGDVTATLGLDLAALADRPGDRWATWLASPVAGRVAIPRRSMASFKTLPSFARDMLPPVSGEVRLDAYADGTLARPFLAARARGWGLTYGGAEEQLTGDMAFPVDLDALLTYDSAQATLDAHVTRGSREVLTFGAGAAVDLAALTSMMRGPRDGGAPAWTGGFHAKLTELPIGEIPLLGDLAIGGHASGVIAMTGLNEAPTLSVDLDVPDLKVGDDLFFERGAVSVRVTPKPESEGGDVGTATVELVTQDGGKLSATAYAGVRWEDRLWPAIDEERAADLLAHAEQFRLAIAQPLLRRALSKMDGYLDGDVRVGFKRAGGDVGSVNADLRLTEGVVHIPELGQELREMTAKITAEGGVVRFDDVSAAGISGRVHGWALARLDGLKLRDAAGRLTIAKGEELPLTLEGVPLGTAWGDITFAAEKREGELAVRVMAPELHVRLPATSARNVQSLDDNPDVTVSHPLGPERERRSADALRYVLTFELGDVAVEGSGLKMRLTSAEGSPPRVVLSDEARVSGDIVLTSGTVEVMGKDFELERGLVRLRTEEASNPYLNVTAYWDAPDGTRIFVDYVGVLHPITDEKLRFRSSPPSSQKDILARLLFGADFGDGHGGVGQGSEGGALQAAGGVAVGVGGELASAQFNAVLNGIAPLRGLSTRFGTSSEGNLRTSLIYELDDNLTALATYEGADGRAATTGTPSATPGGAANQRTSRTEVSIDWRFHRNWSLRGTVGVGGTQSSSGILDLLWQYRY